MKMLRALFLASVLLWQVPAFAGTGTVTGKDATGATVTFATTTNGAAANIGQATVCDGTAAAQCVAVKAASTAAIASDPALVVSVSPNNTIAATQSGTWNIGTLTTLTTITNPVAATQSGTWNITTVTNPVAATQSGTWTVRNTGNAGAIYDGVIGAATAPANMTVGGGVFNSSPITLTTGQSAALQFDVNGFLKVNTAAGAAAGGTSSNFGSAFPTPGTAVGMSDGTNMVAFRATNYGTTPGAIPALAVNSFVTNANANGRAVSASSSPVVPSSAPTAYHVIWPNNTTGILVSTGVHTLMSCQMSNNSTTAAYLKIYNKATAPTTGTDTPIVTAIIPGPAAGGGGSNIQFGPGGLAISLGLGVAVTTVITDADTTAPAASTLAINCQYD